MTRRRVIALGALLALASAPAYAEEKIDYKRTFSVFPIVVDGPDGSTISLSALFESVTTATKERVSLRVLTFEEMFVAVNQAEVRKKIDRCGSDAACISSGLRRFNARYGIVVLLNFELTPVLMNIQVLDTDAGKMAGERLVEVESKATAAIVDRLQKETDAILTEMGFVPSGKLVVKVEPPTATIELDGGTAPDLGAPGMFTLAPGRYRVRASAPGWDSAESTVEVKSGEIANVELSLSQQTSWYESPWLWIAAGAVVIGTTTAVVVSTSQPDPCFCITYRGDGCGCPR